MEGIKALGCVAFALLMCCLAFVNGLKLFRPDQTTDDPCQCQKCEENQLAYDQMNAWAKAGECICFDCNCASCMVTRQVGDKRVNCVCNTAKKRELEKCEAKCCEVAK